MASALTAAGRARLTAANGCEKCPDIHTHSALTGGGSPPPCRSRCPERRGAAARTWRTWPRSCKPDGQQLVRRIKYCVAQPSGMRAPLGHDMKGAIVASKRCNSMPVKPNRQLANCNSSSAPHSPLCVARANCYHALAALAGAHVGQQGAQHVEPALVLAQAALGLAGCRGPRG